jgi:hypothetical protein
MDRIDVVRNTSGQAAVFLRFGRAGYVSLVIPAKNMRSSDPNG